MKSIKKHRGVIVNQNLVSINVSTRVSESSAISHLQKKVEWFRKRYNLDKAEVF
ncbi:MAG: hypothetical protein ACK40G_05540 [Cytophagaceae bacterium]